MIFLHETSGSEANHVTNLFDWHAYEQATVVDVGGSHGLICVELAQKFPELKFIVQDLPEVIAEVSKDGLKDTPEQITFMPHDFFHEQPVKNADIYFLRFILHDWPNQYGLKILRNLIPALKAGARILLNEMCLPGPGEISCYQARSLRLGKKSLFYSFLSSMKCTFVFSIPDMR